MTGHFKACLGCDEIIFRLACQPCLVCLFWMLGCMARMTCIVSCLLLTCFPCGKSVLVKVACPVTAAPAGADKTCPVSDVSFQHVIFAGKVPAGVLPVPTALRCMRSVCWQQQMLPCIPSQLRSHCWPCHGDCRTRARLRHLRG